MAEAAKKEIKEVKEIKEIKVNENKDIKINNQKKDDEVIVLKPSYELDKKEIEELQKVNIKLVKRFNKKYNSTSYSMFLNLSDHVKPFHRFENESDYYLILEELKNTKFNIEKFVNKDIETIYIQGVPVRLYEVLPRNENSRIYAKYNVFISENSIVTEFMKFSEHVLVKKENPKLKFLQVGKDTDLTDDEKQGDFIGW